MTRTRFLSLLAVLLVTATGCSASSASSDGAEAAESSDDELRSVATAFFERAPLSGARMENLRREVGHVDDGYAWTRNQGTLAAMQWDAPVRSTPLADADRIALAQAAFTAHLRLGDPSARNRPYLGKVETVATTDAALDAALDFVGLDSSSGEASTNAERAKLATALRSAARTRSITVLKGELHYQVDMYWENALVVLDEDNHQVLVVTGGYGT